MIAKLSCSLKEGLVKYMIEYTVRTAGAHDHNFANSESLLIAFGKWKPEEGLTVHAFVANLVNGGYILVEAGDPKVIASFVSKFTFWNEVNVVPVVDIGESVPIAGVRGGYADRRRQPLAFDKARQEAANRSIVSWPAHANQVNATACSQAKP